MDVISFCARFVAKSNGFSLISQFIYVLNFFILFCLAFYDLLICLLHLNQMHIYCLGRNILCRW